MPSNAEVYDALKWAVQKSVSEMAERLGFKLARTSNHTAYSLVRDYIAAMTHNLAGVTVECRRVHAIPMLRIALDLRGQDVGDAVKVLVSALAEQGAGVEWFNGHGYVIDVFPSRKLLEDYFEMLEQLEHEATACCDNHALVGDVVSRGFRY